MKINLSKYLESRNIVEWAIIHMMAKRDKSFSLPEWKHNYAGGTMDAKNLDVVLKIEGVEVNFVECIEEINRQHNQMVRDDAKKLVDEQFGGLYSKFEELKIFMDEQIELKKKELGWI